MLVAEQFLLCGGWGLCRAGVFSFVVCAFVVVLCVLFVCIYLYMYDVSHEELTRVVQIVCLILLFYIV